MSWCLIFTSKHFNIAQSQKFTSVLIGWEAWVLDFCSSSNIVLYASCQIMVFHFSINKILLICNWLSKREWRRRWKQKQQVDKQMWMCTWIPDLWIAKEHTVPSTLKINSSENTARKALPWLGHARSQDNALTKGCTGVQLTIPPPAQSTSRRSKLGNLHIFSFTESLEQTQIISVVEAHFAFWDWLWKPHQTETQWWWSLGSSQQCQTGMMNSSSLATDNSTTDGDVPGTRRCARLTMAYSASTNTE